MEFETEPVDEFGDDIARRARAAEFSRRALLHAGWAVPVVLTLRPTAAFAQSNGQHTDTPHDDGIHTDSGHTDSGHTDHADTPHGDSHNDAPHLDESHSDTGVHGDSLHQDTALIHVDENNVLGLGLHADITLLNHADAAHSDTPLESHSDVPHADHTDIIAVELLGGIIHADVFTHTDGHGDRAGPMHGDNNNHTDVDHADTAHVDTPHGDQA